MKYKMMTMKKRMIINRLKEFGHMPRHRNCVYTIYLECGALLHNEKQKGGGAPKILIVHELDND